MSTLDVLNAISEAHAALVRTPELEAQIKALTDERDFVKLERDEAELTIQRLKARITELENDLIRERQDNLQKSNEIGDLSNRNIHLDETVNSLTRRVENLTATKNEQLDLITALRMDKAALEVRLDDAKGYGAKLAIHPRHVAGVNSAFSPSAEERDYAEGVIAAFEAAAGNAFTFRGRMIDEPVIRSARRVLARA